MRLYNNVNKIQENCIKKIWLFKKKKNTRNCNEPDSLFGIHQFYYYEYNAVRGFYYDNKRTF